MPQVSATAALYFYLSGAWTQLDDVQPWDSQWGIPDNGPLDFLAGTGELKFRLENADGQYTPGGPSALAGFKVGLPVKLVVTFEGEEYIRFRGFISGIDPRPSIHDKTSGVVAVDWLDYAARHQIVNAQALSTISSDRVMDVVTAEMEVQPQQVSFAEGVYDFSSALDAAGTKTTAMTEFGKIAMSEIAPIYLIKDKANGETLVAENFNTRHGWVLPGEIPLANADSDLLLKEDGDFLLLETGDNLILNETTAYTFDSSIISDYDAPYGEKIINHITLNAYPRRVDASPINLFELDEPIPIAGGATYTLEGTWADPGGGWSIAAQNVITPAATTDYLAFQNEDGSGTNLTADLVLSNWLWGSEGFTVNITNTNVDRAMSNVAYITQFNVRGEGIYEYNPIIRRVKQPASLAEFEAQFYDFHQKYRRIPRTAVPFASGVVLEYSQPHINLKSVTFCANKSATLMMAFLHTDVGDLRAIDIDELGIDKNYYIQGVEARYNEGLIWVTWLVKEMNSLQGGLTGIAVEFGGSGTTDGVNFGDLDRVSRDTTERTFAAWIYLDVISGDVKAIIAPFADTGGVMFYVSQNAIVLYSNRHDVAPGTWNSSTTSITTGSWFHVVCTYDHRLTTNDPLMYINGVAQTVTEINTPSGSLNSELGTDVVVGNAKTVAQDYTYPFDGKIADARIYNRIITAAEALTLYNGGTPSPSLVTDGLVFQAFAVTTPELSNYVDVTMNNTYYVLENMFKARGRIHGTPIGRAAP